MIHWDGRIYIIIPYILASLAESFKGTILAGCVQSYKRDF